MRNSLWLVILLVCAFVTPVQARKVRKQAQKQELDAARALFKEGAEHFKKSEYREAAASFRAAYRERPNWKVLYNIAQSEAAAKRHGLALTAFERYLALGGDDVVEARQDEVEKEIARLKKMVGYVTVEAPDGATIIVDSVEYGVAPIAGGIPVAGSVVHIVDIVLPGGEKPPFKKVSLVSGNKVNVSFIDEDEVAPPPPKAGGEVGPSNNPEKYIVEPEPEKKRLSPLELAGFITLGTGAAMLIGGGVTGGLALKENKVVEKNCSSDGCYAPYHDNLDKRDLLTITTNALLGVGGVAAAAGAGLLIFSFIKNKKERESEQAFLVQPILTRKVAGASVEVRF